MKLLVLGGTRFLGRHLVDAALARGHEVTVFTRGKQPDHWGGKVASLTGNRDPAVAPGLEALAGGAWDAVVDTSGYVPDGQRFLPFFPFLLFLPLPGVIEPATDAARSAAFRVAVRARATSFSSRLMLALTCSVTSRDTRSAISRTSVSMFWAVS